MGKETLESMLELFANERLRQIVVSNPVDREKIQKVKIRPVLLKENLAFQAEELIGTQAFHRNLQPQELKEYLRDRLQQDFRQAEVISGLGNATVLVSKKGNMTVRVKRSGSGKPEGETEKNESLSEARPGTAPVPMMLHNRQKKYVLKEGIPVPFLVDLGVMTADGTVVRAKYDKFRQINRFLEFIEDILPKLDRGRETTIIDFGCGKSYLTFAMYYYLHILQEYPIRVIGLDLKRDVIARCSRLAEKYGYHKLKFYHGDIASYEGVDQVDMVVTLHACDTATDYALAKAVRWGARVILSVPCCQHELNRQIQSELLRPVLQYGLLKERMAALCTDALRAELLEGCGYRTQILEFIDMEHTPKNILIRAVYEGRPKNNSEELRRLTEFLGAELTLQRLLRP